MKRRTLLVGMMALPVALYAKEEKANEATVKLRISGMT